MQSNYAIATSLPIHAAHVFRAHTSQSPRVTHRRRPGRRLITTAVRIISGRRYPGRRSVRLLSSGTIRLLRRRRVRLRHLRTVVVVVTRRGPSVVVVCRVAIRRRVVVSIRRGVISASRCGTGGGQHGRRCTLSSSAVDCTEDEHPHHPEQDEKGDGCTTGSALSVPS